MAPATAGSEKKSTGDRHKYKRHTVALDEQLYQAMVRIAAKHRRPVLWQVRQILEQAAIEENEWPPNRE